MGPTFDPHTIEGLDMEHLDTFLHRYPPFDELAPETVAALAAQGDIRAFGDGESILVEDGPPAAGLWVLLTGSLDLVHEGEVVQVIEPGECFGHPSLLTGLSPAFTVRAREPSECALFPREAGQAVMATAAGARYIARTMRKRLTRTGHTVHGLHDVGPTPVSAIMRPPIFCEPDTSVRDAARRIDAPDTSVLLVELPSGELGVVTDAEIRHAAAADPARLDAPAAEIARTAVPAVRADQLAIEATVDMLTAGVEPLIVRDRGTVRGVITAADLLGLEAGSPIALRHVILGAADEQELEHAAERLSKLFLLLVEAGVPSSDIGRVLTLQHDAVVARLIDFAFRRHGPAPVAWAWLDLGSAARREFTLGSDQDNALAYADPPAGHEEEVDAYFAQLGADVNAGLARCGIGIDNNGVLAGQRLWRMSKSNWLRTFQECLHEPDESHLIRATVAFDFRAAAGGLSVAPELTERIRAARRYPQFMRLIARTAAEVPLPLTFRGNLAVDDGRLDLKRGGIIPLVNLARFHALAHGVTISPTLDRIGAVESLGGLTDGAADALRDAFGVIMRIRFERHAAAIRAGEPIDNLIDPTELSPIVRTELREALGVIKRSQRHLGAFTPAVK
jgi:CBS domain-containing protein